MSLLNLCASPITIELRLHKGTDVISETYSVGAGQQQVFQDVMATLVTGDAVGSLEISSDGPVIARSRTYNATPAGTFGQSLDGVSPTTGLAINESAYLQQLAETSAFRSNIGILNMGSSTAAVAVTLYATNGGEVGTFRLDVPPGQLVQEGRPYLSRFGRNDVSVGHARISVESGSGVFVYGSVVDNATGDPTTVAMERGPTGCKAVAPKILVDLGDGVTMTLVRIEPGTFTMGSSDSDVWGEAAEKPAHSVTLEQAFYLGESEVTQAQWKAVMGWPIPTLCGNTGYGNDYPAYCITWDEVCGATSESDCTSSSFIGKLNAAKGTTKFRLATEAEWEYAARGGTTTRFSFGDGSSDCAFHCGSCPLAEPYLWWCGNQGTSAHIVKSRLPNAWGLYDMHGNVAEWVADGWHDNYEGAPSDGSPWTGGNRVLRGGGWNY